jgi:hypothetical protein
VASRRAVRWAGVALRCLAIVLVLAVAGCGKSEVEKFADRLKPLDAELAQQKARVASTLRGVRLGSRADARTLRQQIQGIASIEQAMSRLERPREVKVVFERYLRANSAQVTALNRVATALESGDRERLRRAGTNATLSEGSVRRAADALRDVLNQG